MKLINTNKKGFGVHSPKIFSLITDIIFPDAGFYDFERIRKIFLDNYEQEIILIIYRLLNFFQPEVLCFFGNFDEKELTIYRSFAKNSYQISEHKNGLNNYPEQINRANFIVLGKLPHNYSLPELTDEAKIICIKYLEENTETLNFFQKAVIDEKNQITIKFRKFGIIIVDKKYQKQNYVIKSTNLLQI